MFGCHDKKEKPVEECAPGNKGKAAEAPFKSVVLHHDNSSSQDITTTTTTPQREPDFSPPSHNVNTTTAYDASRASFLSGSEMADKAYQVHNVDDTEAFLAAARSLKLDRSKYTSTSQSAENGGADAFEDTPARDEFAAESAFDAKENVIEDTFGKSSSLTL